MVPVAPARLSTTHCCPVASFSFCASMRPIASVEPPAAHGMISRTGLDGYSCAGSALETDTNATAIAKCGRMRSLGGRRFAAERGELEPETADGDDRLGAIHDA